MLKASFSKRKELEYQPFIPPSNDEDVASIEELISYFKHSMTYYHSMEINLSHPPEYFQKYPADIDWKNDVYSSTCQRWEFNQMNFRYVDAKLAWQFLWIKLETGKDVRIGYRYCQLKNSYNYRFRVRKVRLRKGTILGVLRQIPWHDDYCPGEWHLWAREETLAGKPSKKIIWIPLSSVTQTFELKQYNQLTLDL